MTTYEVRVDKKSMARLVRALNKEADGRELKADLVERFKAAAEPAELSVQAAIMSMPSEGYTHVPLRGAIAAGIETSIALGGRTAGVNIKARRVRVRGFWHSPKRTNRDAGWAHPVFASPNSPNAAVRARYADKSRWVHQEGLPGWFDRTLRLQRPAFRRAAKAAMDDIAQRIDRRTRG